jgi:hypothetical protein
MAERYPSLYQVNTRVWLTRLSQTLGRTATIDDIPDAELDRLSAMGFDWIWLLSVWRTGPRRSRSQAQIRSGVTSFRRRCPISTRTTSRVLNSRLRITPSIPASAVTPRWRGSASASGIAASV